ncbi:MAG: hypothetical protein ACFFED_05370 [Candidatus Thorarchaeota archaeon]
MAIFEVANFWLVTGIALLVIGEAFALLIGMNTISTKAKEWLTLKNNLLLAADVITGGMILFLLLFESNALFTTSVFYVAMAVIIFTHVWRDIEYLFRVPFTFLANSGLFAMNNIKLVGAVCSFIFAMLPST